MVQSWPSIKKTEIYGVILFLRLSSATTRFLSAILYTASVASRKGLAWGKEIFKVLAFFDLSLKLIYQVLNVSLSHALPASCTPASCTFAQRRNVSKIVAAIIDTKAMLVPLCPWP